MAFFRNIQRMETRGRPRADNVSSVANAAELTQRRSRLPASELDVLVRYHPNLLIVGKESAIAPTVLALMSDFYPTVTHWPEVPDRFGSEDNATLIVPEVGCLTQGSLDRLAEWLDTPFGRCQIVSTSSTSLHDRVQQGLFPAALYYRLNTLLLTIDS